MDFWIVAIDHGRQLQKDVAQLPCPDRGLSAVKTVQFQKQAAVGSCDGGFYDRYGRGIAKREWHYTHESIPQ
jgi:hypothetical protein